MKTIDVVLIQVLIKRTDFTSYTRYNDFTIKKTFFMLENTIFECRPNLSSYCIFICIFVQALWAFYNLLIITVTITSL